VNPSNRSKFEVRSFCHELSSLGGFIFFLVEYFESQCSFESDFFFFFVWMAALAKTMDNLRKRKAIVLEWCCMCKRSGESLDHLFLHCEVVRELWSVIFSLFGVER
jgi:hypothetical protein